MNQHEVAGLDSTEEHSDVGFVTWLLDSEALGPQGHIEVVAGCS